MIRRTSHYHDTGVTASDGRTFRVDVVCVGADLRVRPWGILRFDEDGRTRRSAPTKGYTSQRVTRFAKLSVRLPHMFLVPSP